MLCTHIRLSCARSGTQLPFCSLECYQRPWSTYKLYCGRFSHMNKVGQNHIYLRCFWQRNSQMYGQWLVIYHWSDTVYISVITSKYRCFHCYILNRMESVFIIVLHSHLKVNSGCWPLHSSWAWAWACIRCHEHVFDIMSMSMHLLSWACILCHEHAFVMSMSMHSFSWACIRCHAHAFVVMSMHSLSWACIRCHEHAFVMTMHSQTPKSPPLSMTSVPSVWLQYDFSAISMTSVPSLWLQYDFSAIILVDQFQL